MSLLLTARTEAGARLVALAEALAAEIATARGGARPRRQLPARERRPRSRRGLLRRPGARATRRDGRDLLHDVVVASSRLARGDASLAIGVNMHMAGSPTWCGAGRPRARRRRAPRAAFGASSAIAERRRAPRGRGLRARSGPHAPGDDRDPHAPRVADRGPQALLHGSPAATVLYTSVSFAGEDGARALRLRERAGRRRRRDGPRRLGRARHAGLREPLRHLRRRRAPRAALRGGFPAGVATATWPAT